MGDLFSAISGSSKKAAKKQQQAAFVANELANDEMNQSVANFQPYLDSGVAAQKELNTRLGLAGGDASSVDYGSLLKPFTGEDLVNTPGYQFQLQQGNQAIDRKQASSGNYLSGAALKESQRFAQDYAGTSFQAGYDRNAADKSRVANFLTSVAQLGQSSANSVGTIRQNFANQFSANAIGSGNAAAAGIMGQSNAIGGAINAGLGLGLLGGSSGLFGSTVQNGLNTAFSAAAPRTGAGLSPSSYLMGGSAPTSALESVASSLPFFLA